jgi:hypothetical protein
MLFEECLGSRCSGHGVTEKERAPGDDRVEQMTFYKRKKAWVDERLIDRA